MANTNFTDFNIQQALSGGSSTEQKGFGLMHSVFGDGAKGIPAADVMKIMDPVKTLMNGAKGGKPFFDMKEAREKGDNNFAGTGAATEISVGAFNDGDGGIKIAPPEGSWTSQVKSESNSNSSGRSY